MANNLIDEFHLSELDFDRSVLLLYRSNVTPVTER
jgi:hypothetical protein